MHEECGHQCGGVAHEKTCLPCIQPACCGQDSNGPTAEDLCNICFTSELGEEPCVQLPGCKHIFHAECIKNLLKHRWSTLRISFDFMACPACKHPITDLSSWPQLQPELKKLLDLKKKVGEMTKKAVENELVDAVDADKKCAFYECHECKKPFFGGQADCERDLNMAETTKKEDLICKKCAIKQIGGGQFNCPQHGHKYIAWKCSLCCSEALFRCGPTYYCDDCHSGH